MGGLLLAIVIAPGAMGVLLGLELALLTFLWVPFMIVPGVAGRGHRG